MKKKKKKNKKAKRISKINKIKKSSIKSKKQKKTKKRKKFQKKKVKVDKKNKEIYLIGLQLGFQSQYFKKYDSLEILSDDGNYYVTDTITVSGTTAVQTYNYFSDSSCSSESYTVTYTYSDFTEGADMVFSSYGASGGSGKQFTMTHDSVTETPQTSGEVSWYNNNSYCGETDWALNIANDTTGLTCGGSTRWTVNTTIYGLYLLDGNSLFSSISSSTYPSSVSTGDNDTYTKQ